jgi:hypothetical protein
MDFIRKYIGNEKGKKINWITRLVKNIKSHKQKDAIRCSDYSSIICLRCDRCWANSSKGDDKQKIE